MVTVEKWGTGHPDYFRKVYEAFRTRTVKEYDLKPNEKYKAFGWLFTELPSLVPYRMNPLAPNASVHSVDMETGIPTPYTVPKGYELRVGPQSAACNEPFKINLYVDGILFHEIYQQYMEFYTIQEVAVPFIGGIDPTYSNPHTVDWILTNLGSSNLKGWCFGVYIMEAKKTEVIKTKKVRCRNCGYIEEVDLYTSKWVCPNCGVTNLYFALPFGGV